MGHKDASPKNAVDFISKAVKRPYTFRSQLPAGRVSPGLCGRGHFAASAFGVEAIVAASEAGPRSPPFLLRVTRGEGANPSSHGMADDLGDTKDCWKQAFRHPQGVVGPAPLPTPVWAEARMGDSPGPEAGGQARASSGEAEAGWAGGDGVSVPEKHCARATVFLEHKPCSKAETFTCNRETFIL